MIFPFLPWVFPLPLATLLVLTLLVVVLLNAPLSDRDDKKTRVCNGLLFPEFSIHR